MGAMLGRNATHGRSGYNLVFVLVFVFATFVVFTHLFHAPTREIYRNAYYKVKPMVEFGGETESSVGEGHTESVGIEEGVTAPVPGEVQQQETEQDQQKSTEEDQTTNDTVPAAVAPSPSPDVEKNQEEEEHDAETPGMAPAIAPAIAPTSHEEKKSQDEKDTTTSNGGRLTKELIETVAKRGSSSSTNGEKLAPVVVTWANYHYLDFVLNWVYHIQATGCETYLVGAMDDELLKVLVEKDIPSFAMSSGLSLDDFGWGSSTFFKMGREKISLLQTFTKWGYEVLISDVDTVWMKNPLPYLAKYPSADILVSSDHLGATVDDGGLEKYPDAGSAANIGIMLFRPKAAEFVDKWVAALEKDENYWDQNAFNDLFRIAITTSDDKDRLFLGYNATLTMGILPVSMFCSGHTYFVQNMPEKLGLDPYVVHATFQYSGTPGKRNRFREKLLWHDPDSYFEHAAGFISSHHKVPERLLRAVREGERQFDLNSTVPHFNLVNAQLKTIRTLFALGTALGRAVVMPKLYCGMDRWWAPHDGIIPGASSLDLPFVCPLDHVMDLEWLEKDLDEATHGPKVEWREYSFLDNPKASDFQSNKLVVITCAERSTVCDDGSKEATIIEGKFVKIKAQRTDEQIRTALSSIAARYKLLEFENPVKLWKGFASHEAADKFSARYTQSTSLWCCVEPPSQGQPGHVWYDMWFDSIPHTNRFSKWVDTEWKPTTGP